MRANSRLLPFCANDLGKLAGTTRFTRRPEQTSRRALTAQGDSEQWNTRNWQRKADINYRSDTPHLRPGRKLTGKRLSPHRRPGRRWGATRNQTSWFAATAGATTWLRASSSGGIADAASVSVNAMDQRHGRGRRRSRSNLPRSETRDRARKGSAPFRLVTSKPAQKGQWTQTSAYR